MRRTRVNGSVLAVLLIMLSAFSVEAQSHGPPGFAYPAPDQGRALMFGGDQDDSYWSWFEIGPDVCGGLPDGRIFAWLGGRRISVPCAEYVHARVAPGRHPKNWGQARDPIRAQTVSVVLSMDPPALVTLDEGRARNDRRVKDVGRILITEGNCADLVAGFRTCRTAEWDPSQALIVHPTAWVRDGLPLHMLCTTVEEISFCRVQDTSETGLGQVIIDIALPGLDADTLAFLEPLYGAGSDAVASWAQNRTR